MRPSVKFPPRPDSTRESAIAEARAVLAYIAPTPEEQRVWVQTFHQYKEHVDWHLRAGTLDLSRRRSDAEFTAHLNSDYWCGALDPKNALKGVREKAVAAIAKQQAVVTALDAKVSAWKK